jgi:hypothetical protein
LDLGRCVRARRLRRRGRRGEGPRHRSRRARTHGVLASDALNGRGSGTRDEWIAAEYIAAQLRLLGLDPLGEGGEYVQTIDTERPARRGRAGAGADKPPPDPPPAPEKVRTWNVVGRLRGRDADRAGEIILLSAHLDHIGNRPPRGGAAPGSDTINNGADDDASGCVAVLELAKALAAGRRPRRTIVFAFFGSEEAGGLGSRHFTRQPTVPIDRIVANLQFEMIGRPDPAVPPLTLWLTGYERSNLGPTLARRGARVVQDPHPQQNFFFRSDNIRFARLGVVAHTLSSYGLHTEYHSPSDETRLVDYAHMTRAIRSLIDPIEWLANSKFKPAWVEGGKPE